MTSKKSAYCICVDINLHVRTPVAFRHFLVFKSFSVSGHESTTQTLGFTIFELARRPNIQEKLRNEIASFSAEPTYDQFRMQLPYLDAVLKEA